MKAYIKSRLRAFFSDFTRKSDIENLYRQLAAFIDIKEIIGPRVPLGSLRGWALSPDALLIVLRDIVERASPRIVEFGTGKSTIAIAAALRQLGAGTLVSFEHDADFGARLRDRLGRANLLDFVDMRLAPLREYPGNELFAPFRSYDLGGVDVGFDVVVVDGPIGELGIGTRSLPLNWAVERLGAGGSVYLDDAGRADERTMVACCRSKWRGIEEEWFDCEKGLLLLRRVRQAPAREQGNG